MNPRLRRYLLRQVAFVAVSAALMFLLAGRLDWLGGWLVTAIQVGSLAAQWLIVGRRHPDLLLERSGVDAGPSRAHACVALAEAPRRVAAWPAASRRIRRRSGSALPGQLATGLRTSTACPRAVGRGSANRR